LETSSFLKESSIIVINFSKKAKQIRLCVDLTD